MQPLPTGLVMADVVRCPPLAERLAAHRELADEIRERTVLRIPARLRAQGRNEIPRRLFPVDEELRGGRIQERETRGVRRLLGALEQRRIDGTAESVRRQVAAPHVAESRRRSDAVA